MELEEADGVRGLILELVEGPTLVDRIARGPISIDETWRIARQIAEAVEAAHEEGIIHRDLKPVISRSGRTAASRCWIVAATVRDGGGVGLDLSNAQTMTATIPGMILGTAPYMSPEQANGREMDRTADVWAFGCVLYEMLAGCRAFVGETTGEVLAGVLKTDPDWHRLPIDTPEGIRRLLRRCLQKDQKLRFRDIRDARLEIDEVQNRPQQNVPMAEGRSGGRERLVWGVGPRASRADCRGIGRARSPFSAHGS